MAQGDDWQEFVVKDGQLITGQNPASSEKLAACVLETIKPSAHAAHAPLEVTQQGSLKLHQSTCVPSFQAMVARVMPEAATGLESKTATSM